MDITSGTFYVQQGIMPTMELIIDGYKVHFTDDTKRSILDNCGAVYLNGYPEEKLPVITMNPPLDYQKLYGFTQDEHVVRIARRWLDILKSRTFAPGVMTPEELA